MKKRSEPSKETESLREKIIGLGEYSLRKNYYPELQKRLTQAEDAERNAGEALALVDTLLATAPVGFAFLDRDLRFVRINKALAAMTGIPAAAYPGHTLGEVSPERAAVMEPIFRRVLATGEPVVDQELSRETAGKPGQKLYWLASCYPVRTHDGETLGVGMVTVEITERKRAEEERTLLLSREQEARRRAEDANAAKDRFLATVSHELRNPLAPIRTGVAILRRCLPQEAGTARTLAIMERNIKILARLLNDMLDISRMVSGDVVIERKPVRLDAIVQAAIEPSQTVLQNASLSLISDLQPNLWVCGDAGRLRQAVENLLSNAIRFTPAAGEVRVRVALCTATEEQPAVASPSRVVTPHTPLTAPHGTAHIVVEDTGIGISPDVMHHLFEVFQRGVIGGWGKPGLGIGLALTKWIIAEHGGQIWAESEGQGKGSRFTIELPLIPAPA